MSGKHWLPAVLALRLMLGGSVCAAAPNTLPNGRDLQPADGVEFILNAFERYSLVAMMDMPGSEEFHRFLRTLVQAPRFRATVRTVIVDFGNPRLQAVIDRYVLDGALMPTSVLRHVWDDTTESPDLTWDSPVYAQFFDAVRAVNLTLPPTERVRVILGDAPIVWRTLRTRSQWLAFRGAAREKALAEKLADVVTHGQRALIVAAPARLLSTSAAIPNARALLEQGHPGRILTVLPQARFGAGDTYKEIEAREAAVSNPSIVPVRGTWLGAVPLTAEANSPRIEQTTDAVLHLGETRFLTRVYPSADQFRDEEFWTELNRRWRVVHGAPFSLSDAGFDLRAPFDPRAPRTPAVLPPPPTELHPEDAFDFVFKKLAEYPMVGLGDQHMCLEFLRFLERLLQDPRLPGNVQDIVIEAGNPIYQSVIDRYVVDGQPVPRSARKPAWQYAAMGWYEANSPVYEEFYDLVRRVNLTLPKEKRVRIVLGDAPLDVRQIRANPDRYLQPFVAYKETLQDPREISLAASVTRVLASGHHALIICGNGHLKLNGRPGNARRIWEPAYPGRFYLIDQNGPGYAGWPNPSIIVIPNDPEPSHATLWLGPFDMRTSVRPSPLVYRNASYWSLINVLEEISNGRFPLDLTERPFQYRGRYFQAQ